VITIVLCLSAIVCGMGAHFWILARLESSGFQVKYFATLTDNWRAYVAYRRLAKQKRWPAWPFYLVVVGAYGGLLGACLILVANHSLLDALFQKLQR
jgi:hypothetical protein